MVAPKTDDPFRAKALIGHWLACNPGMFVRIDVPAEAGLTDWLEALGLSRVDHVAKMARNGDRIALHDDTYAQYGIINQAIC